jgi:hypothetical protein
MKKCAAAINRAYLTSAGLYYSAGGNTPDENTYTTMMCTKCNGLAGLVIADIDRVVNGQRGVV